MNCIDLIVFCVSIVLLFVFEGVCMDNVCVNGVEWICLFFWFWYIVDCVYWWCWFWVCCGSVWWWMCVWMWEWMLFVYCEWCLCEGMVGKCVMLVKDVLKNKLKMMLVKKLMMKVSRDGVLVLNLLVGCGMLWWVMVNKVIERMKEMVVKMEDMDEDYVFDGDDDYVAASSASASGRTTSKKYRVCVVGGLVLLILMSKRYVSSGFLILFLLCVWIGWCGWEKRGIVIRAFAGVRDAFFVRIASSTVNVCFMWCWCVLGVLKLCVYMDDWWIFFYFLFYF